MSQIKVERNVGGIKGLCVISHEIHSDNRGRFIELYNEKDFFECGINISFVQDNLSVSHKGVLRGLHYQKNFPQDKLVGATFGSFYDVAVDLRESSPTYGKYFGIVLSQENHKQFLIPKGFAHGFLVLEEGTVFYAKVSAHQHKGDDCGIVWNDPDIGIDWPFEMLGGMEPIMTEKDKAYPRLSGANIK